MNRVIKFRGWDNERNVMRYRWLNLVPDSKYARVWGDHDEDTQGANDDVAHYINEPFLMQFTGLLDKNGKECWEGDVVRVQSRYETDEPVDTEAEIRFSDGAFRLDFHGMLLNQAIASGEGNWSVEVIGNVWENPDLIK